MVYLVMYDTEIGLLGTKSQELLSDFFWNLGFYIHIVFGGIALLVGWIQFNQNVRTKYLSFHKTIGRFYVISALLGALAGFYLGFHATGTWLTSLGFICLGVVWFGTTFAAYIHILRKNLQAHQKMMTYSYAACWAAVTLRIWLPFLNIVFSDFVVAYTIVAWLCWVPNLGVAWWINKRRSLCLSDAVL